jgi:hypothetical protein
MDPCVCAAEILTLASLVFIHIHIIIIIIIIINYYLLQKLIHWISDIAFRAVYII